MRAVRCLLSGSLLFSGRQHQAGLQSMDVLVNAHRAMGRGTIGVDVYRTTGTVHEVLSRTGHYRHLASDSESGLGSCLCGENGRFGLLIESREATAAVPRFSMRCH